MAAALRACDAAPSIMAGQSPENLGHDPIKLDLDVLGVDVLLLRQAAPQLGVERRAVYVPGRVVLVGGRVRVPGGEPPDDACGRPARPLPAVRGSALAHSK